MGAAPSAARSDSRAPDRGGNNHIEQVQRARVLGAMVQAACERGACQATVANVVAVAGISRRTFYELYPSVEACLLAAFDDTVARAAARVLPAYRDAAGGWRERIRAGLVELLCLFEEQPQVARLLVVEWLAAGPRALERRERVMQALVAAVDEGREQASGRSEPSPLAAEAVVGGVVGVLHARLLDTQQPGSLIALLNPLMSAIVLPFLGPAAAAKELGRPPHDGAPTPEAPLPDTALEGLGMRVTYRTLRVLAAVAANPGASNRVIAEAAEVSDQGQISKLLARLCKIGLVENSSGSAAARGERNAWTLTARGEAVRRSLRVDIYK